MNVVSRVTTPVTAFQAKAAVNSAFRTKIGRDPELTHELPLLMSLVWIETARGKSVQNFNLGNISASESFSGNVWRPTWFELGENPTERDTRLHQAMLEGKAPRAFRAYADLASGASDFMAQLQRSFPEVLEAASAGDPTSFRDALATSYSKDYIHTPPGNFESLAREFGFKPVTQKKPRGLLRLLTLTGLVVGLGYGAKYILFGRSKPTTQPIPDGVHGGSSGHST